MTPFDQSVPQGVTNRPPGRSWSSPVVRSARRVSSQAVSSDHERVVSGTGEGAPGVLRQARVDFDRDYPTVLTDSVGQQRRVPASAGADLQQ
jgi:hypothetical protein